MTLEWLHAIATSLLLLGGAFFTIVAAIGVLRFPDLLTRSHAASKAGTVGSGLTLLALALDAGDSFVTAKALLAIAFFVFTAPLSAHLLARAARKAGAKADEL